MAKKEEYERVFNELLGIQVKWSKLSLEELSSLATVFTNPDTLAKKLKIESKDGVVSKNRIIDAMFGLLGDEKSVETPIIDALRNKLKKG